MYNIKDIPVNSPSGSIVAFPSATIPEGWAMCDGSEYNAIQNPNLHIALGSPNPAVLPNLNAAYLRGTGTGGGYTGPTLRGFANDKLKGHSHAISNNSHSHSYKVGIGAPNTNGSSSSRTSTDTINSNTSGSVSGITLNNTGSETRPYTYVINWIIKLG